MTQWLTPTMLVFVGVIHVLPVTGVGGVHRLGELYGIGVTDPNLEILLRHRAVLFGLLGAFLIGAAFRPALQPLALIAGLVSVVSFLWLAHAVGEHHGPLGRVVVADIFALACLIAGSISFCLQPGN